MSNYVCVVAVHICQMKVGKLYGLVKRAGVMLFHHQQEKWVPGAYIKIGKFRTNTVIEYQDEIHGSLLQQAEKVIDHIYTKS